MLTTGEHGPSTRPVNTDSVYRRTTRQTHLGDSRLTAVLGRRRRVRPVTGQLADMPTRGLPTSGLDDSRTGQLADANGDFACLVFVLLAASTSQRVVQSATCPVRELAYPRVVQLP